MTHEEFINKAIALVEETSSSLNHEKPHTVYVVWSCKTLQNSKAILSTSTPDHRLYEVTMDGGREQIYFDRYKKEKNVAIKY